MKRVLLVLAALVSGVAGFALTRMATNRLPDLALIKKGRGIDGVSKKITGRNPAGRPVTPEVSAPDADTGDSVPILECFLADLTEDRLEKMLLGVMVLDQSTRLAVVDLFLTSTDPVLHDIVRKSLLKNWYLDKPLLDKCLVAVREDQHRGRTLILTEILGEHAGNNEVAEFASEVLAGRDDKLQMKLLENLRIGSVHSDHEVGIASQLRDLAVSGRPDSLRAVAVGSMGGSVSATNVRFLLDRVLQDPALEVRRSALGALPYYFSDDEVELTEEVMIGLFSLFKDPLTPQELRKPLTFKLARVVQGYKGEKLTQAQCEEVRNAWKAYEPKSK